MSSTNELTFNPWSLKRIEEGRKVCTSRSKPRADKRVLGTVRLPWWFIKERLYSLEGADSPEELQRVINQVQRRVVTDDEQFWVHFGEFGKKNETPARRKPMTKFKPCPFCGEKTRRILTCPRCGREGCPECMPAGAGCICPECEEKADEDED